MPRSFLCYKKAKYPIDHSSKWSYKQPSSPTEGSLVPSFLPATSSSVGAVSTVSVNYEASKYGKSNLFITCCGARRRIKFRCAVVQECAALLINSVAQGRRATEHEALFNGAGRKQARK